MRRLGPALLAALAVGATAAVSATAADPEEMHGAHGGAAEAMVSIGFADFSPSHIDVLAGDTVTWTNRSVRIHTVTARDESWDSGRMARGATFRRRFDVPGHLEYFCRLHVLPGSLDVHALLLEPSREAAGPGVPRRLAGRAALSPGASVGIEADTGAGFVPLMTATVDGEGAFAVQVSPRETTRYRAVSGLEASPPVTLVVLDRRVAIAVRERGRRAIVRAKVDPPSPGVMAVLQMRLPERFGWWPVARRRLDRSSQARFAVRRRRVPARVVLTLADGATVTALSRTARLGRGPLHHD